MPNAYASLDELWAAAPDSRSKWNGQYDGNVLRLLGEVSRAIDNHCKRTFYPALATRYFVGSGGCEMWIPDLVSVTSVSISDDYGVTYTSLVNGTDYIPTVAGDENSLKSYSRLVVHPNSTELTYWPPYFRGVKIVGVWAYTDNRDMAWEDTGDTTEDNPLSSSAAYVTVNDVDGADAGGVVPRFSPGQILKAESEFAETTPLSYDNSSNTIGILRGRNGTTAASHVQNTTLYVWRTPEPVKQAVIAQTFHQLGRGLAMFGDARAIPEVGQLFFIKALDPEVQTLLTYYVNARVF